MTTTTDTRELDAWLAEHLLMLTVEELPFFYDPENGVPRPRWDGFIHDTGEPDGTGPFVNVRRSEMGTYTQVHGDPLPALSTTGDGMLLVLEAMHERGYHYSLGSIEADTELRFVWFHPRGNIVWIDARLPHRGEGKSWESPLPLAVGLAARQALEAEEAAR